MELYPLRIHADTLVPSVMVLGGEAFRRGLGDGGRAPVRGINVPVKDTPESTPCTRPCGDQGEKCCLQTGSGPHHTLGLQAP